MPEAWSYGAFEGMTTGEKASARFTAFEDMSITGVGLRFSNWTDGSQITIELFADDQSGNPTGAPLASVTTPASGLTIGRIDFDTFDVGASAQLEAGKVYHVVVTADAGTGRWYHSNVKSDLRPFDRGLDTAMTILNLSDSDWVDKQVDPYLVLYDGTTAQSGAGQPYDQTTPLLTTRGSSGTIAGQRFVITDQEVPAGALIQFDRITLDVSASATDLSVMPDLLLHIRDEAGNILGTAQISAAEANSVVNNVIVFDPTDPDASMITLVQGQAYLLTTQYAPGTTDTNMRYRFGTRRASELGGGSATWGGTTISMPILPIGGAWANGYTASASELHYDMAFWFEGLVIVPSTVPEPTTALIGLTGALACSLRRPGRRQG